MYLIIEHKSNRFTQESRIKHHEKIISLRLTKLWIPRIRLDAPTIHNIVSPRYRAFEAQCISLIDKSKDTNYEHELIKRIGLRSIHKPVIKTIKCKVLHSIKRRVVEDFILSWSCSICTITYCCHYL